MSSGAAPGEDARLVTELRRTLGRLEAALATIDDSLVITSPSGMVQWCNASFERLVARPRLLLLGRPLATLLPRQADGEPLMPEHWHDAAAAKGERRIVVLSREPLRAIEMEWEPVLSEDSRPLIFCFRDISARISNVELREEVERVALQRAQAERVNQQLQEEQMRLAAQVIECPVTGLPNRRGLQSHIARSLRHLRNHAGAVSLLFCDLNRFKEVNDLYGHQVGDELLIEIARRLQDNLGPGNVLARLGGDEFVALTASTGGDGAQQEAVVLAQRLQRALSQPWLIQGTVIHPSMSVGIATSRDPLLAADELLRRADMAMYEAKSLGGEAIVCYDEVMDRTLRRSVAQRARLEQAIGRDGLCLLYQPIVDLEAGRTVGVEALVRLLAPGGDLIPAQEFLPLAERTGLIYRLGTWVLDRVLHDLQNLGSLPPKSRISLNLSPREMRREGFAAQLLERIRRGGIAPERLAVEVGESILVERPDHSSRELAQLREAGMHVHIDNFGSDYSSMAWLARHPVDAIKLERAFIAAQPADARGVRVLEAMVELAHDLDLAVVVQGVENEEHEQRVRQLGCHLVQGWRYGRESADLSGLLRAGACPLSGNPVDSV